MGVVLISQKTVGVVISTTPQGRQRQLALIIPFLFFCVCMLLGGGGGGGGGGGVCFLIFVCYIFDFFVANLDC
jgi:hypothetical protein